MTFDVLMYLIIESGPNWLASLSFIPFCLAWLSCGSLALLIFALVEKLAGGQISKELAVSTVAFGYVSLFLVPFLFASLVLLTTIIWCLYQCTNCVSQLTRVKFE